MVKTLKSLFYSPLYQGTLIRSWFKVVLNRSEKLWSIGVMFDSGPYVYDSHSWNIFYAALFPHTSFRRHSKGFSPIKFQQCQLTNKYQFRKVRRTVGNFTTMHNEAGKGDGPIPPRTNEELVPEDIESLFETNEKVFVLQCYRITSAIWKEKNVLTKHKIVADN